MNRDEKVKWVYRITLITLSVTLIVMFVLSAKEYRRQKSINLLTGEVRP